MVRPAGIEPATDGLEIRSSIQLSYGRKIHRFISIIIKILNVYLSFSKPVKPKMLLINIGRKELSKQRSLKMVGVTGFEPATTWSQTTGATRLRYTPSMIGGKI